MNEHVRRLLISFCTRSALGYRMIFYTFQAWNQCIYKRSFETYTRDPYMHTCSIAQASNDTQKPHEHPSRIMCAIFSFVCFDVARIHIYRISCGFDATKRIKSKMDPHHFLMMMMCVFDTDANLASGLRSNGHFLFLNSFFFI